MNTFLKKTSAVLFTVGAVTTGSIGAAHAAGAPSPNDILAQCGKSGVTCYFHPHDLTKWAGSLHQVGNTAINCGTQSDSIAIGGSDTTGGSNSVGTSITAGFKAGEIFSAEVQATYSHEWNWSHTTEEQDTLNVPAQHIGWIERGTPMQGVTGSYEVYFDSPWNGHYMWFVDDVKAQSEDTKDTDKSIGVVLFKDRQMTPAELRQNCGVPGVTSLFTLPGQAGDGGFPARTTVISGGGPGGTEPPESGAPTVRGM
jgi:hypothetical protein